MLLLRFIAVAVLTAVPLSAVAEPLDKDSCVGLQRQRNKLLTREMQAALDRGPDWVKTHLNPEELEQVLLPPARDELLERLGDRCLLGALAAHLQGTFEQAGVEGQICRHV